MGIGFLLTSAYAPNMTNIHNSLPSYVGGVGSAGVGTYAALRSDPRTFCFRVGEDFACAIPMVDESYMEMGQVFESSTGKVFCPFSAVPSSTASVAWAAPGSGTSTIAETDIMSATAGGRSSCILMIEGFTSTATLYELECTMNIEYIMGSSYQVLLGSHRIASDVFAREAAGELWSKQGSQYGATSRSTGTYGR